MDVLLEIVLECLGELVIEGGSDAATNPRLPRWLRWLVLAGMGLFFAAIFAAILTVGVKAFHEVPLVALLLFALDAGLVFLGVHKLRKILRTLNKA